MDPRTTKTLPVQIPQREEPFPVQEQDLIQVGDRFDRTAEQVFTEQIDEAAYHSAIIAPVFVP